MGARKALQLGEEGVDLALLPHRVTAHERRAGNHAVGEERATTRGEEIALVAPQREEREAVGAVRLDERPRDAALPHRLRDRLPERAQPEVDADCGERGPGVVREVVAWDLDGEDEGDDRGERGEEP